MKYLTQFLIIIGFSLAGELLNWLIPLPIPASIYGIILLFTALKIKWVKVEQVKELSSFLILIMPLMFLPPAVGIIDAWDSIKSECIIYTVITLVSTLVVMGVTGIITQGVIRRRRFHGAR